MKKLDKKQIPQVIILAVLACAVFGWFAFRMITPTPAAAHSPAATVAAVPEAGASGSDPATPSDPATVPAAAVPPGPGLRDPFVQAISGKSTPAPAPAAPASAPAPASKGGKAVRVAALTPAVPPAPPLPLSAVPVQVHGTPSLSTGRPTVTPPPPVVIPPPAWTVTGVLASGSEHVAILRSGDARRFVRKGDAVDGLFVVAAVTSDSVVLRHGTSRFTLPLGGAAHTSQALRLSSPRQAAPKARPADVTQASPAPSHVAQAAPVPSRRPVQRLAVTPAVRKNLAAPCLRPVNYVAPALPALTLGSGLLPVGSVAPDFSLPTLGGDTQALSQHRGQVVLLHFWSSWCPTCQAGLPLLTQLADEYAPRGLTVLSVNSWDSAPSLRSFLARQGLDGSSVLYDSRVANESVAVRLYNAPDVPTLYVIDRNGAVAASYVGYSPKVISDIKRVLASLGIS